MEKFQFTILLLNYQSIAILPFIHFYPKGENRIRDGYLVSVEAPVIFKSNNSTNTCNIEDVNLIPLEGLGIDGEEYDDEMDSQIGSKNDSKGSYSCIYQIIYSPTHQVPHLLLTKCYNTASGEMLSQSNTIAMILEHFSIIEHGQKDSLIDHKVTEGKIFDKLENKAKDTDTNNDMNHNYGCDSEDDDVPDIDDFNFDDDADMSIDSTNQLQDNYITLHPHPISEIPCISLHPCHTNTLLNLIASLKKNIDWDTAVCRDERTKILFGQCYDLCLWLQIAGARIGAPIVTCLLK